MSETAKELNAGEDLDALLAEKVMGWENNWDHPGGRDFPYMWGVMDRTEDGPVRASNFPNWSTDNALSLEIVAEMSTTTKERWTLEVFSSGAKATFEYEGGRDKPWIPGVYEAIGCDLAEAIALTAAQAVGIPVRGPQEQP